MSAHDPLELPRPVAEGTTALQKVVLCAEVLLVYARFRRQMRRHDVRDVVALARRPRRQRAPRGPHVDNPWGYAHHLNRAVDRTLSALPTDSRCLIQSIVLSRLLASRGMASTIVIGARSQPEFLAHAWVEYDGRAVSPVVGYGDARLTEL